MLEGNIQTERETGRQRMCCMIKRYNVPINEQMYQMYYIRFTTPKKKCVG